MLKVIAVILIVGGIVLGLYVGIWQMFIGGICDLIEQIKLAEEISGMVVGIGVAKVLLAGLVGMISGLVPVVLGGICWVISEK